jgi:hypothetical protein
MIHESSHIDTNQTAKQFVKIRADSWIPQTRETPATMARVPLVFGSIYSEKLRGDAAERLKLLQLSMGITSFIMG